MWCTYLAMNVHLGFHLWIEKTCRCVCMYISVCLNVCRRACVLAGQSTIVQQQPQDPPAHNPPQQRAIKRRCLASWGANRQPHFHKQADLFKTKRGEAIKANLPRASPLLVPFPWFKPEAGWLASPCRSLSLFRPDYRQMCRFIWKTLSSIQC